MGLEPDKARTEVRHSRVRKRTETLARSNPDRKDPLIQLPSQRADMLTGVERISAGAWYTISGRAQK